MNKLTQISFRHRHGTSARRGLALVEVVVVIALVVVSLTCAWVIGRNNRRAAQQTTSIGNLRQIGAMMASYTADSAEGLPALTWLPGVAYPGFAPANSDIEAQGNQATSIIRRRFDPAFVNPTAWIAQAFFSHLALADHAGLRLPNPVFVSPSDDLGVQLLRDPAHYLDVLLDPNLHRYVVRGSYSVTSGVYYRGQTVDGGALRHGSSQRFYTYSQGSANFARLLAQSATAVAFPSQKAYMWDSYDRTTRSRPLFYMLGDARVPVLTFDGSAGLRNRLEENVGAYSRVNGSMPETAIVDYEASAPLWPESPTGTPSSGSPRLEFTFRQLGGRDFGERVP